MFRSLCLVFVALLCWLPGQTRAENADATQALQSAFDKGELVGLHGVLVRLDGKTFVEIYFDGGDQRWGAPMGIRQHGADTLHDMRSVTKSVVGLLYGIALDRGMVPPPSAPLLAQFPEYPDLASDPARARITIADALTMRMGIEWDETLPYTDPRNSEIAMEAAEDRYRFVLAQPIKGKPGNRWVYNGGATALIARLIEKGAGMPIDAFARKTLFNPLGIKRFEWIKGADGVPSAASGLRLRLRDLARIGEMVAQNGIYKGRRIVSADWINQATNPLSKTGFGLRYGYFWWHSAPNSRASWSAAMGNGGQRLTVQPAFGLVIAMTAGNYNSPDDWKLPVRVIERYLAPGLRDALQN